MIIEACVNGAPVSGGVYGTGGIAGCISAKEYPALTLALADCRNTGDVTGTNEQAGANHIRIGGILGVLEPHHASAQISGCVNAGTLAAVEFPLDADSAWMGCSVGMGGILGYVGSNGIQMDPADTCGLSGDDAVVTIADCSNTGAFHVQENSEFTCYQDASYDNKLLNGPLVDFPDQNLTIVVAEDTGSGIRVRTCRLDEPVDSLLETVNFSAETIANAIEVKTGQLTVAERVFHYQDEGTVFVQAPVAAEDDNVYSTDYYSISLPESFGQHCEVMYWEGDITEGMNVYSSTSLNNGSGGRLSPTGAHLFLTLVCFGKNAPF